MIYASWIWVHIESRNTGTRCEGSNVADDLSEEAKGVGLELAQLVACNRRGIARTTRSSSGRPICHLSAKARACAWRVWD